MIDWKNCKSKDFSVSFIVEEIVPVGTSQVFPVNVYHTKTDEFAFMKTVPINAEFYNDLREKKDWRPILLTILKARVEDDIVERINTVKLDIDDKLSLFSQNKESL